MQTISSIGYKIYFGKTVYKEINAFLNKNKYSKYFVFCDENSFEKCYSQLLANCKKLQAAEIIEIDSGEASKNIEICQHIWETMLENNADRNTLVINLGGGVVSDLGGFVASVYKRGIDFVNIPTTALSMADASVGGKTGIDFANLKNVIGTITQPKAVFVNIDYLLSLPQRHFMNGIAEILKMALISDRVLWKKLRSDYEFKNISELLHKSVELKNKIVKRDPTEKNVRKALNFGHTIGHAVESVLLNSDDELLHGEAVVVGMIAESFISYKKKLISKNELDEIVTCFKNCFTLSPLHPQHFEAIDLLILNDKKNSNGKTLFSLLNKIGGFKINQSVTPGIIKSSLEFYNSVIHGKS
jgi:3-dehydroquinate synthase